MTEKTTLAASWGRSPLARWAPIPLRLIVGFGFMQHGFAKMSRGPDAFAAILHALGVPAPHFMAWVSILIELLGGLTVLVGAFLPLASIPLAILLLVAVFTVHLPNGFSSIKLIGVTAGVPQFGPVGYEVNVLYLACLAALVLGGAGPFALDAFLQARNEPSVPRVDQPSGLPCSVVNTNSSSATCSGIAARSASTNMECSRTSRRDFLVFV